MEGPMSFNDVFGNGGECDDSMFSVSRVSGSLSRIVEAVLRELESLSGCEAMTTILVIKHLFGILASRYEQDSSISIVGVVDALAKSYVDTAIGPVDGSDK